MVCFFFSCQLPQVGSDKKGLERFNQKADEVMTSQLRVTELQQRSDERGGAVVVGVQSPD